MTCLLTDSVSVQAQTGSIHGTVIDQETKAALPVALVRLRETHASEIVHADGTFGFLNVAPGRYTVVAERIGYAADSVLVTVVANQTAAAHLALRVSAIQLADVMVTGSLRPRASRDALSAVSVVSGAELDRKLDGTVAGTLRTEPGVSIGGIGPATARPVIRGLGGNRILMLEDGQRPGDMSSTSADHAVAIEPLTAERFEVVRGPMSLIYGSSALGGVVNVIRHEIPVAVPEDAHGSVMTQLSSVNRGASVGGYGTFALGGFGLRGDGSIRRSDDVRTPSGTLENTAAVTASAAAGAAAVKPWGHVGGSYRMYANDYGIPGGFVGGHESGVDIRMRRHTFRLGGEIHPKDNAESQKVVTELLFTDYNHVEMASSGVIGTRFDQTSLSADIRVHHDVLGPATSGAIGLRAEHRDITTGGSLNTPSTSDMSVAGYVVEEFGTGRVRLQTGARYDMARFTPEEGASITTGEGEVAVRQRSFGSFSGSVGVLYAPAEAVRIGSSISRAYRTPDFNELYSDGPHLAANSYDVGDPELAEETGFGVDVFARVTTPRVEAEIAAFGNSLNNYIFPSSRGRVERGPQRGRPRLQFTNEDAVFSGFEGEVRVNFSRRWVAESNVSYVRAKFTSDRAPIPIFENQDTILTSPSPYPPLIPPLSGNAALRYETARYFGSLDLAWAARQERTGDFETVTEGYAVPGMNAGIRILRGPLFHTLTLRVDNLLDQEYRQHLSRIKDVMPEPGRNVSLLYRVSH